MKRTLFILALFIILTKSDAQDSTNKSTGIITKKWIGVYKIDGHRISEKELKTELYKVPAAIPFYKKAHTNKIIGYSFTAPAFLFGLLSRKSSDPAKPGYYKNKTVFSIAGIVSSGAVIFFLSRSLKNIKKAIGIRNEKIRAVY